MRKPRTLEWRPRAMLRLDLVLEEIDQHNPLAAENFCRLIIKKLGLALSFPMLYRASTRVDGVRELVVTSNYFMPYRVTPEAVEVLDLVHTRRDWPDPATSQMVN